MKNYRHHDRTKNKYNIPTGVPAGSDWKENINIRPPEEWPRKEKTKAKKLFTPRLIQDIQDIDTDPPSPDLWDGEGLFLYGDTGAGKTVLSATMLLDVEKHLWLNFQKKECRFTSVPLLLDRLKKSFNDDTEGETEWDIMDQQKNAWLLVLDDLGVNGRPSEWLLEKLYLIINDRYEYLRPTIITSNLDLNELSELFGDDRITSRIDRMCSVVRKSHWRKGND